MTLDRLYALINNPRLLQTEQQECYAAGRQLVEYRLSIQQDLPTRLKHIYSWNLNSWKTPDPASDDPKTRRCRRLLRTGPVCLQETKWDKGVPERLAGYLPGTKVFFFSIAARTITALTVMRSGRKLRHLDIVGSHPKQKQTQKHKPKTNKSQTTPTKRLPKKARTSLGLRCLLLKGLF